MAQATYFKCPTCGQSRRDAERVYSEFHYAASAARFISQEDAERLANINIDRSFWIECHHRSFQPFALIESAVDIGQSRKTVTAIANLAMLAKVPAYLVLFTMSDNQTGKVDIVKLRVQCVWSVDRPKPSEFRIWTPKDYFEWLVDLRERGKKKVLVDAAKDRPGQPRNHDIKRLERKIDNVNVQQSRFDFW